MTYIPALNQVQLGQEGTLGTPDTLDIMPAGLTKVVITPRVKVVPIPTLNGSTMPAKYNSVTRRWAEVLIEGNLDYNRAMLWLDGMFGADASSPHTYKADEDAAVTPKGLTMGFGQTGLIYQVAGIVPTNLGFKITDNAPWQFSYKGFSKAVTDGASLETLTEDVPEFVNGYETSLYMDEDLDATIGSTARDVMFSLEVDITANHDMIWKRGAQTWTGVRQGKWGGSAKLIVEADATALDSLGDILDAVDSGKGFTCRAQATDGTNTMKLDFMGVAQDAPQIPTDVEGVVSIEFALVPHWNSVYDSCWGAELTIA